MLKENIYKYKIQNQLKIKNIHYLIVKFSINNIFITLISDNGKVLYKNSSGLLKFNGPSKKTNLALRFLMDKICLDIKKDKNIKFVKLLIKADGANPLIKYGLYNSEIINIRKKILSIEFLPKQSHNGMRQKKIRRI